MSQARDLTCVQKRAVAAITGSWREAYTAACFQIEIEADLSSRLRQLCNQFSPQGPIYKLDYPPQTGGGVKVWREPRCINFALPRRFHVTILKIPCTLGLCRVKPNIKYTPDIYIIPPCNPPGPVRSFGGTYRNMPSSGHLLQLPERAQVGLLERAGAAVGWVLADLGWGLRRGGYPAQRSLSAICSLLRPRSCSQIRFL